MIHNISRFIAALALLATAQGAWAEWTGLGTAESPYQIKSTADLDQLATDVNSGTEHEGDYFVLTTDLTYSHETDWNDATSTENNFVAIGGYYDSNDRYFRGDFDGAGHTISGIRIHRSGTDNADSSQGIFGRTSSGANIHSLRLADTRITGYDYTGGIVGDNNGTVTDCHVASNVCIHAVQSYAWYHGGIVGYNYGIVEGCTSAATLTIASDATDCGGYGAIAGSNWYGTLRDNLAIGATVPATTDNYHGAIAGSNYGTLQHNYYTACTVAGVENATGKGCKNADVDGARHAVSIVAADGVNIVPTGTATTYAVSGITIYEGNNGISYGGQFYAGATEQVVLTLTNNATGAPVGYQYGFTASAGTLSGSTLIMPDEDVTISVNTAVLAAIPWAGDGSLSNPYIIEYPSQLDLLAHRVNGTHGETLQSDGYSGKYFRLGADIAYTYTKAWNDAESTEDNFEAIGYYDSNDRYFRGDFDGAGHTVSGIRIYRSGTDYADSYQGIFGQTGSSATIHSLRLADTRITGYDYTGGIVGDNNGTVTDCHVASNVCIHAVQSYAWNHGGIVGCNRGTVENCTSAATLTIPTGATNCQNYGAIAGSNYGTLRDNLAIGATVPATTDNYHGVIAGHNDGGTLQRNYYTACTVAGVENATGQGCENADADGARHAVSIVAADGVTIVPTGTATTYAVSGITIYEGNNGISYDGQFYAGATEQVELTLSNTATGAPAGYQYDGYTASAGTLSGTTLTMPDEDVTISAALAVIDWATANAGTSDDPYMIYNKDQLDLLAHRVNGTHGQTLHSDGYSGKYFRLGADIAYTYTDDWDVATSTEDNYEAIGSSSYRSFRGDFDGAGHTISGIRIHRSGTATADSYQGIFGRTSSGANIHSLRLADARITGYDNTGGIVGYNDGGTVTDCHVASDVCIHAAQTNAWNHGGIVGYNYGIVEGCTSAATLTIASDATDCENYGAIAGHNDGGTLRDNLAIGATVPAAAYNYHGATVGYNSSNGTLQHNYYTACNVAGVANATGQGCQGADITANNGALPAYRLDLGANITTPPGTFVGQTEWLDTPPVNPRLAPENGFTLAGNHYFASGYVFTPGSTLASGAAQGYTPRATLGGQLLDPYTPSGDTDPLAGNAIARLTVTADCDGKTLAAALRSDGLQHEVSYMTADGTPGEASAIALDGTETTLAEGTYFAGLENVNFDHTVNLTGDVTLILKDGCTMNVGTDESRIDGKGFGNPNYNIDIYAQSLGTGALTIYNSSTYSGRAPIAASALTINGGIITADASGTNAIYAYKDVTINRGTVTANGHDRGIFSNSGDIIISGGTVNATAGTSSSGINARAGNVAINGGNVTATGGAYGIYASGVITLGWTRPTDRITASSISTYDGTVAVADGQALTDGSGHIYTGTLTASDINGKTLKPHWAGNGSSDSPYIISRPQELDLLAYRVNGTHGETLQSDGYSGKYFRLGADITYNHSTDWDDATSEENNYEAIGGYYGSTNRYFRGDFDGAGHTISGIRIHRSGTGYANSDQGIFGQTDGANIHGLRLADARITGYDDTGGIVGFNDGTVTDCHVASNVCIHTVQSGACYHGGIAGYNYGGTVENCTSAATLTIASSATSCGDYGAIAGYNYATLSDNLAIGTTVPATGNNSYGAIVGRNYGTLQRNYYTACKVASENVTPSDVGCANADVAEMTKSNVTYYDGAVPALRDQADNTQAIALLAALAQTDADRPVLPLNLGWGAGQFPMQLAGRTLYKDGSWNTLCLPFSVDLTASGTLSGDNVQAMTLNTATSNLADGTLTLNFDAAETIPAGTPFIIKWDNTGVNITNPVFMGVTVSNATNDATVEGVLTFTGTYKPKEIGENGDNTKLYLGAANKLYYPTKAMTIGTHRAYFQLLGDLTAGEPASSSNAQQIRAFNLNFGDDEATGIVSAEANSSLFTLHSSLSAWYTLDGRRLDGQPTAKGLYIHGGKKVAIK